MLEFLQTPEIALSLISGVGGFFMKMSAQRQADFMATIKLGIEANAASSKMADAAAKRSDPQLRKVIALIVILCTFGALVYAAFHNPSVPVSIIEPSQQKSLLWGLFKWGDPMKVITAQGLVFPEWVKFSIITIISFLFGTGAAKVSR